MARYNQDLTDLGNLYVIELYVLSGINLLYGVRWLASDDLGGEYNYEFPQKYNMVFFKFRGQVNNVRCKFYFTDRKTAFLFKMKIGG